MRKSKATRVPAVCTTCLRCRKKKAKCDGFQPSCSSCTASHHLCIYPNDKRLVKRAPLADVNRLREELVKAHQRLYEIEGRRDNNGDQDFIDNYNVPPVSSADNGQVDDTFIASTLNEDGRVEVHGVSSYLRNPGSLQPAAHGSKDRDAVQRRIDAAKDHLFANAAFQRQREASLLHGCTLFGPQIDLDGVPTELAVHLLDLHWNRRHFAYLMTYRPAFFDSLDTGGPYANKLLLNSIYFSSCCQDSDRDVFQTDVNEPSKRGERFYTRFKELLVDEIDKPSLPTIASLIGVGTTLVSTGQQNAGWVLCGIVYRMIINMGLHLKAHSWHDDSGSNGAVECEMRARIYYAAFMIDNYQSLYIGRPPYLRSTEARVPKEFLDWYEELENWSPYIDPIEPLTTPQNALLSAYTPRPVYALSAFTHFIRLGEIAASVSTLYSIDCFNHSAEHHRAERKRICQQLATWQVSLPANLRFSPLSSPTPPPNQIVPHALYHTLRILLERPFLSNGPLSRTAHAQSQEEGRAKCIDSCLQIKRILEAYGRAFSFRRTPYLLSYATYCAIVILLDEPAEGQYEECVGFFWSALLTIQRGTHFGLKKPLKILHALMQRQAAAVGGARGASQPPLTDPFLDTGEGDCDRPEWLRLPDDSELEAFLQQDTQSDAYTLYDWRIDENGIVDDSLIGLLDPSQPAMQFSI